MLHHSDYPADVWVFSTEDMCSDFGHFAASELLHRPLDATFNLGSYEVTAVAYQHLLQGFSIMQFFIVV